MTNSIRPVVAASLLAKGEAQQTSAMPCRAPDISPAGVRGVVGADPPAGTPSRVTPVDRMTAGRWMRNEGTTGRQIDGSALRQPTGSTRRRGFRSSVASALRHPCLRWPPTPTLRAWATPPKPARPWMASGRTAAPQDAGPEAVSNLGFDTGRTKPARPWMASGRTVSRGRYLPCGRLQGRSAWRSR